MKNTRFPYLLIAIAFIWLLILSMIINEHSGQTRNQNINEYNVSGFSTDFTKVVSDNKASIVTINTDKGISSGFVYKQDDDEIFVAGAYHAVADCSNIEVVFGNSYSEKAQLLGYEPFSDLAILHLSSPYKINALNMGDSTLLKQGEFLISIGTPESLDYSSSVQLAMVSSLLSIDNSIRYNDENFDYYLDVIVFSSHLQAGYSGSPLLNMNGDVVGMNTMAASDNTQFAITANEIKIIADNIIAGQPIQKTFLGIKGKYIADMPNYEKSSLNLSVDTISGLYVSKIKDNSLAALTGIRNGDVIIAVNDITINKFEDFLNVSYADIDEYSFDVLRNGESIKLTYTRKND